jgi:hypothetical protein
MNPRVGSWKESVLVDILKSLNNKDPKVLTVVLSRSDSIIERRSGSNNIDLKTPKQLFDDFPILLKHLKEACTKDTISFETILNLAVEGGAKLAHVAAAIGNLEAVQLIASHDAPTLWERTTCKCNFGLARYEANALDIATYNLHMGIIHFLLLGCNASLEALTERVRDRAAILCAAAHSGSVEIIEFLLSRESESLTDVNEKSWVRIPDTPHFHPPLYWLIKSLLALIRNFEINEYQYSRHIKCMWLLLSQGACINYDNGSDDSTFLHMIAVGMRFADMWPLNINTTKHYHIKLLGALFLGGADREARDTLGGTRWNPDMTLIINAGEKRNAALLWQFLGRPTLYWATLTALAKAYADSKDLLGIEIYSYVQGLLQESEWANIVTQPSEKYNALLVGLVAQFRECGLHKDVPYQAWLYVVGTTWNAKQPDSAETNLAKGIRDSMIQMGDHLEAAGIQFMHGRNVEGISAHRRWSILDWYGLSPNNRMVSQIICRQMHQVKAKGLPQDICYAIHDVMFPPSIRGLKFFPSPLVKKPNPDAPVPLPDFRA